VSCEPASQDGKRGIKTTGRLLALVTCPNSGSPLGTVNEWGIFRCHLLTSVYVDAIKKNMSRPWRIEFKGTLYHVLSQGTNKRIYFGTMRTETVLFAL